MNVEHINPFIQGTQRVFSTICDESPALGKLFIKNAPYVPSQVSISVAIVGDIKGEVVYNMKESAGFFIASKMMFGMPVSAFDEMTQSAISELANMISGNVATIFANKGFTIDIKTPQFKIDAKPADFTYVHTVDKVVCVPLNFDGGHVFEVDIVFP